MRLGTRWPVGAEPPERLPQPMRAAVRTVEEELTESDQPTAGWGNSFQADGCSRLGCLASGVDQSKTLPVRGPRKTRSTSAGAPSA